MGDEEWVIPLMTLAAMGAIGIALFSSIKEFNKPKDQRTRSGIIDPGGDDGGVGSSSGGSDSGGDCGSGDCGGGDCGGGE